MAWINVYMVITSDTTVSVVTHFPTEEVGKAAAEGIGAVREKAAEHFGMTMVSVNTGVAYSSQAIWISAKMGRG